MDGTSVRQVAGQQSYNWWLAVAGGLVVAVAGLFGGLRSGADEAIAHADPGQSVAGEPWNVTIDRARSLPAEALPPLAPKQGTHWLVVAATIEVTADTPMAVSGISNGSPGPLTISGVSGIEHPWADDTALVMDASLSPILQPGLPQQVAFLWEQVDSAPVPSTVTVTVVNLSHQQDSFGDLNWMFAEPRAEVVVPVTNTPPTTPTGSTGG